MSRKRRATAPQAPRGALDAWRAGMAPLSAADCICAVCLELFNEPVALPCRHVLCRECLRASIEAGVHGCSQCRTRALSFARLHKELPVDSALWDEMRRAFPDLVAARLRGETVDLSALQEKGLVEAPAARPSLDGEVGRELLEQAAAEEAAERARREAEERASEEAIAALLKEEREAATGQSQAHSQASLAADEALARRLSSGDVRPAARAHEQPRGSVAGRKQAPPTPHVVPITRWLRPGDAKGSASVAAGDRNVSVDSGAECALSDEALAMRLQAEFDAEVVREERTRRAQLSADEKLARGLKG